MKETEASPQPAAPTIVRGGAVVERRAVPVVEAAECVCALPNDRTAVLAFCLSATPPARIARAGFVADAVHPTLAAAQAAAAAGQRIVVVDGTPVPPGARIAPGACQNIAPFRPPIAVAAGGGYVTCRPAPQELALLLIYRRGVWDLPKGKQDPGETLRSCAAREVREEVGITALTVHESLGTTVHGYAQDEAYVVKTTHWYRMETPERSFRPERSEGIRRVAWARWAVARRHIGYDTLAAHMDRVADTLL